MRFKGTAVMNLSEIIPEVIIPTQRKLQNVVNSEKLLNSEGSDQPSRHHIKLRRLFIF